MAGKPIDFRKQFWIDFRNSDFIKEHQERLDKLMFRVLTGKDVESLTGEESKDGRET